MNEHKYEPESYWSKVGELIGQREDGKNVVAGDDEPYYRYKREKFLEMLRQINFKGETVLEVGCGPGGNLLQVHLQNPSTLTGVDISQQMIDLAKNKVPKGVDLYKSDGRSLPFADDTFNIVFTATVLQHNTDEHMLKELMAEIARVASDQVILFERVESEIKGDELCLGRPVSYYEKIMKEHGYTLSATSYINIRASYYISGAARKLLNPKSRKEGEPLSNLSVAVQKYSLPITKVLDGIFRSKKDICKMEFVKTPVKSTSTL